MEQIVLLQNLLTYGTISTELTTLKNSMNKVDQFVSHLLKNISLIYTKQKRAHCNLSQLWGGVWLGQPSAASNFWYGAG